MAQQYPTPALKQPRSLSMLVVWEAWIALSASIVCFSAFSVWPLHPKGGIGNVIAIVCFSGVAAIGIGMSLAGMRFCKSSAKLAAWVAFTLFAIVVLNIAQILVHV